MEKLKAKIMIMAVFVSFIAFITIALFYHKKNTRMEKIKNLKGIENAEKWIPGITKEIEDLIERANNGWVQGYTCACANLVRMTGDGNGTLEVELLQASVSGLDELRKFKCDESDIEVLLPTIKESNRRRALAGNWLTPRPDNTNNTPCND